MSIVQQPEEGGEWGVSKVRYTVKKVSHFPVPFLAEYSAFRWWTPLLTVRLRYFSDPDTCTKILIRYLWYSMCVYWCTNSFSWQYWREKKNQWDRIKRSHCDHIIKIGYNCVKYWKMCFSFYLLQTLLEPPPPSNTAALYVPCRIV